MFFLRIAKQKHLFYIIVAEKRLIFKAFSRCCGQHFYCVAINIPFSVVSPIQYTEGSHRAVEITLGGFFAARKTERRFSLWYSELRQGNGQKSKPLCAGLAVTATRVTACCWMALKCSAEPKRRYVAQIAVFSAEAEPIWRRNKISPQGARMRFSVSDSRFSLCPAGCVSRYSKQGLCVPQKSQSQPKSADSLGAKPPIPRKERCVWGKMFVLPSV